MAQARAQEAQRFEQQNRANDAVNVALKNLREHREQRIRRGKSAADDRIEPMLMQIVAMSLEHWTALMRGETARA